MSAISVETSSLRLLTPAARLRVPLATRALTEVPGGVVLGAKVAKGQMLTDGPLEGGPAALAPTSGAVVGLCEAMLTNGQTVPAVELEPDFEDRRLPEEHDPEQAEAQRELIESMDRAVPDELGQWIDRFRAVGVW